MRAKSLRFAEVNGGYDAFFDKFNDMVTAMAGHQPEKKTHEGTQTH